MDSKALKKPAVTFHVFRKDGSKNPDIKLYFLENMMLDVATVLEKQIKLKDDTVWELVLEPAVIGALKTQKEVKCLISFQARVYGNFAVARLFDPNKAKERK